MILTKEDFYYKALHDKDGKELIIKAAKSKGIDAEYAHFIIVSAAENAWYKDFIDMEFLGRLSVISMLRMKRGFMPSYVHVCIPIENGKVKVGKPISISDLILT